MLYDELRSQSYVFSFRGPYQGLIIDLFNHMQRSNGKDYQHPTMNNAYRNLILGDNSADSTLPIIKNTIEQFDFNKSELTKENFSAVLSKSHLPKYTRWKDFVNGMGITVHDTWATHITIKSLQIDNDRYRAVVHYKVQDHFGLNVDDIAKFKFNQFRFFRIWFVLQRYNEFGFRPFMTNMEATVEITGGRSDSKK